MAGEIQFLLGGGTEAERERLEAEFFADDDAFQQMLTAEDDLIDAYTRGELTDSERLQFEQRFMNSSAGRERVYFARAFAAAPAPVPTPALGFFASVFSNTTGLRVAFAALAIVVLVGFPWLLVERARMNRELNALRAQKEELERAAAAEKSKNTETPAVAANPPASPEPGKPTYVAEVRNVVFDVNPGATRGGAGNTLRVSKNVKSIVLRLGLEAESSREEYRAVIETAEGRQVKSIDFKVSTAAHDRVSVPALSAKELQPGDYIISLSAKQPDNTFDRVASYSFRVVSK